jgi:hypothetical protein
MTLIGYDAFDSTEGESTAHPGQVGAAWAEPATDGHHWMAEGDEGEKTEARVLTLTLPSGMDPGEPSGPPSPPVTVEVHHSHDHFPNPAYAYDNYAVYNGPGPTPTPGRPASPPRIRRSSWTVTRSSRTRPTRRSVCSS